MIPPVFAIVLAAIVVAQAYVSYRRWARLRIFSELAWATERNLPLDPTLAALEVEAWNGMAGFTWPGWRRVAAGIRRNLHGGKLLGDACRPWRRFLGAHRLALLTEAERAGRLDAAFRSVVETLREEERTRHEAKETLVYPLYLLGLVAFLQSFLIFIVPELGKVFADLGEGASMMWESLLLARVGLVLTDYFALVELLGILAVLGGAFLYLRSGVVVRGRWYFRLPGFGGLFRLDACRNFCHVLASLAGPGVPFPDVLRGAARSVRYAPYREMALRLGEGIERGGDFAALVARERLLPAAARESVLCGVRAGDPAEGCRRAARYLEGRIAVRRRYLMYAAGASAVFAAGVLVAAVAFSVFGMLYGLTQSLTL